LFIAAAPQNMGLAIAGMFSSNLPTHWFQRVKLWRGVMIVSQKTFWETNRGGWKILKIDCAVYKLPPWPEHIETRLSQGARKASLPERNDDGL
jgi:hypothetical protein